MGRWLGQVAGWSGVFEALAEVAVVFADGTACLPRAEG